MTCLLNRSNVGADTKREEHPVNCVKAVVFMVKRIYGFVLTVPSWPATSDSEARCAVIMIQSDLKILSESRLVFALQGRSIRVRRRYSWRSGYVVTGLTSPHFLNALSDYFRNLLWTKCL